MAKLKQTLSDSAVHVELAVKYWASHPSDFHQFSTIVLRTATTFEDAWIFEHLLISKWQAPLNFPFITEILRLKAQGWQLQYRRHNKQFARVPLGDRLYQRARRKLHSMDSHITEFSFQKTAWTILYRLTSPGLIAFETAASRCQSAFREISWLGNIRFLQTGWTPRRTMEVTSQTQNETSFQVSEFDKTSWHIQISVNWHRDGWEIISSTPKRWPYRCIYRRQSFGKQPFQLSGSSPTIIGEWKNGGILKMLRTFPAVVIGFDNDVSNSYPPQSIYCLCFWRSLHANTSSNLPVRQC